MAVKIIMGEQEGTSKIKPSELRFLLAGPSSDIEVKVPENPTKWISSNDWNNFYSQLFGMNLLDEKLKGIHDFFISDTEQVYRNPQDGTYYKNVDGNWILHNNNGDKISDTPADATELISLVRAGALVQDTITTRESGLQKTGKAILTTFNNAKTTVWNAMKKTGNAK